VEECQVDVPLVAVIVGECMGDPEAHILELLVGSDAVLLDMLVDGNGVAGPIHSGSSLGG